MGYQRRRVKPAIGDPGHHLAMKPGRIPAAGQAGIDRADL
jgi:hypothetical protein